MSVILEFRAAGDAFALGEILAALPAARIEAERIVPAGSGVLPNLWVSDGDLESFEAVASDHRAVEAVTPLESGGEATLYRLDWRGEDDDLIGCVSAADGTILQAVGDEAWEFRLRLPDQAALSTFQAACTDRGLAIRVERTYRSAGRNVGGGAGPGGRYDLTRPQREALLLGLREGYFETPREANLDDLAADLDVSQQALSSRIRRGTRTVLETALRPPEEGD